MSRSDSCYSPGLSSRLDDPEMNIRSRQVI